MRVRGAYDASKIWLFLVMQTTLTTGPVSAKRFNVSTETRRADVRLNRMVGGVEILIIFFVFAIFGLVPLPWSMR